MKYSACVAALALLDSCCSAFVSQSPPQRRWLSSRTMTMQASSSSSSSSSSSQDSMARRELFSWASCAVSAASSPIFAAPASAVGIDYTAVRSDIGAVIAKDKNKGPTLLRLAWHSSGTYDKMQKDGGSGGGSIRFDEELAHGANAGLKKAVGWMEPIAKKHKISHADLYTLAGVVAIESAGGPSIPWRAGRVDAMDPKTSVTPDGRLPAADKGNPMATAQGLRDVFYRMGFGDQEIVALAGAHALGRCHADASGYVGPWSPTPVSFNNLYFTLLETVQWTPKQWDGPAQFEDPTGTLMMLPSDIVLTTDKSFSKYVKKYAKSQKEFFEDFTTAFQKLEELGCSGLYSV